jgi:hypothetical protein
MTGAKIIRFPIERTTETPINKRRLSRILGRSTRWIELRTREGMPASFDASGYRKYRLSEVNAWLEENGYVRVPGSVA